jgi:hypothetical protein
MAILTIVSTVSFRSLMNRSKDNLRGRISDLHQVLGLENPQYAGDEDKHTLAQRVMALHDQLPEDA